MKGSQSAKFVESLQKCNLMVVCVTIHTTKGEKILVFGLKLYFYLKVDIGIFVRKVS